MTLWIAFAPVLGLVQGATGILLYEHIHALRYADTWQNFAMISVFFGLCWFVPSMVLSDLIFIRRALTARELKRYIGVCMACALLSGIVLPGYAMMIGYPITAFAILAAAYAYRKRPINNTESSSARG
jgi:type III secretory pathway component EscV